MTRSTRRTAGWVALALAVVAVPAPADGQSVEEPLREVPLVAARATFTLGANEVLVGRATPDGFALGVSPVGRVPRAPVAAVAADCEGDLPQSIGYLAETPTPVVAPNRASRGECTLTLHEGPIHFLEFRTVGNGRSSLWIWDPAGDFYVECEPVGTQVGAGGAGVWTPFVPPSASCQIFKSGALPDQFSAWSASVTNGHDFGTTYAFLAGLPPRDENAPR